LSSSNNLPKLAAERNTEPARLSRLIRGDIDWIVMKCLEKDRTRRYESASGLARDIQRALADEPVDACPPNAVYRLRKFGRKHRKALAMAVAFLLLLVGGIVASTWQAVRATLAEEVAQVRKREADDAREQADGRGNALAKLNDTLRRAKYIADMNLARVSSTIRTTSQREPGDALEKTGRVYKWLARIQTWPVVPARVAPSRPHVPPRTPMQLWERRPEGYPIGSPCSPAAQGAVSARPALIAIPQPCQVRPRASPRLQPAAVGVHT
jgi:hypothetical protein